MKLAKNVSSNSNVVQQPVLPGFHKTSNFVISHGYWLWGRQDVISLEVFKKPHRSIQNLRMCRLGLKTCKPLCVVPLFVANFKQADFGTLLTTFFFPSRRPSKVMCRLKTFSTYDPSRCLFAKSTPGSVGFWFFLRLPVRIFSDHWYLSVCILFI